MGQNCGSTRCKRLIYIMSGSHRSIHTPRNFWSSSFMTNSQRLMLVPVLSDKWGSLWCLLENCLPFDSWFCLTSLGWCLVSVQGRRLLSVQSLFVTCWQLVWLLVELIWLLIVVLFETSLTRVIRNVYLRRDALGVIDRHFTSHVLTTSSQQSLWAQILGSFCHFKAHTALIRL